MTKKRENPDASPTPPAPFTGKRWLPVWKPVVIAADWAMRGDIPANRDACPQTRPCPHVKCEWNVWMSDGLDRPGRRRLGHPPPASDVAVTVMQNCGADYADAAELGSEVSCAQIATAYGVTERQIRRKVESALKKLKVNPDAAPELATLLLGRKP